jgi:hypothetical protein
VRQLSIADITFNCSRLTWPALALRHAGPWSRKISATSKAGRDTRAASAGRPDLLELERDLLQRAHDLADRLGGDAGIERRGVELGVTKRTHAIMLPFYVTESQSAAERDRLLADDARRSARDKRQCPRP